MAQSFGRSAKSSISFKTSESSKPDFRLVVTATKGLGCFNLYHSVTRAGTFATDSAASKSESTSESKRITEEVKEMVSSTSSSTIERAPSTTAAPTLSPKLQATIKADEKDLSHDKKELAQITSFTPPTKMHLVGDTFFFRSLTIFFAV